MLACDEQHRLVTSLYPPLRTVQMGEVQDVLLCSCHIFKKCVACDRLLFCFTRCTHASQLQLMQGTCPWGAGGPTISHRQQ